MIYYCVIVDGEFFAVSYEYYDRYRQELIAIALGTIDEIEEFLGMKVKVID